MNAIDVQHLKRIYRAQLGVIKRSVKEVVAVEDVSFQVAAGELFGLLGPNGAGKTTTVKTLTTLLVPSSGTATVMGHDVVKEARAVQQRIGFIFGGEWGLYWRLSGIDNLRYFASLYHVEPDVAKQRIPFLLDLVGLHDRGNEKVGGYSRGIASARLIIAGASLSEVAPLLAGEFAIGAIYAMLGYGLFHWFERQAKRRGILETV